MNPTIKKAIPDIISEIQSEFAARHSAQYKPTKYPRERFIASDMHECDRYLTLSILKWDEKPLPNEYVMGLFQAGNDSEKKVQAHLLTLGFELIEGQQPFEIKHRSGDLICRGKIDGKIKWDGVKIPIELKLLDEYNFSAIEDVEYFQKNLRFKRMLWQIQLYLFGNNAEGGLMIFTDGKNHYKLIPVYLDYALCEWLLGKMERCWDLVKKKQMGERMEYSNSVCSKCSFLASCLPEIKSEGSEMIDDPEIQQILDERMKCEPMAKLFEKLDKVVKNRFKLAEKPILVGSEWMIQPSSYFTTAYDIPEDVKKQYAVKKPAKKLKIICLNREKIEAAKGGSDEE